MRHDFILFQSVIFLVDFNGQRQRHPECRNSHHDSRKHQNMGQRVSIVGNIYGRLNCTVAMAVVSVIPKTWAKLHLNTAMAWRSVSSAMGLAP